MGLSGKYWAKGESCGFGCYFLSIYSFVENILLCYSNKVICEGEKVWEGIGYGLERLFNFGCLAQNYFCKDAIFESGGKLAIY